jgi:hypothetical protein
MGRDSRPSVAEAAWLVQQMAMASLDVRFRPYFSMCAALVPSDDFDLFPM